MQVTGLDHVNIIAHDIDATAGFYEALLGFRRGENPGTAMGFKGAWLHDATDRPIIHLSAFDAGRHVDDRGAATGSIDHVALACQDFAGMLDRCRDLGVEHRVNDRQFGDLRQIFVTDPNNVKLELNFAGD